jgi:hypothetical protein
MTRLSEHIVQFYDDDDELITEVARAMYVALEQGHATMCLATAAHRQALERHLTARGIDLEAALRDGRLVYFDADATLARITVNGSPDVERFAEVIGSVVDSLAASFERVWIFGELVALMCDSGNPAGALELEKLWSSFVHSRPVFLHCAYPARAFASEQDRAAFLQICAEHCRVLHSDSWLALSHRAPGLEQEFAQSDRPSAFAMRLPLR